MFLLCLVLFANYDLWSFFGAGYVVLFCTDLVPTILFVIWNLMVTNYHEFCLKIKSPTPQGTDLCIKFSHRLSQDLFDTWYSTDEGLRQQRVMGSALFLHIHNPEPCNG